MDSKIDEEMETKLGQLEALVFQPMDERGTHVFAKQMMFNSLAPMVNVEVEASLKPEH